jgi:hypothetical protein
MTELTTATALDILEDGDLIAVRKAGASGVKKGTASQLRDYILSNLKWKNPVRAKTTAALAANTYSNGASGVGATLTGNANGALAAQDGVTLVANDRLLVADEGTGSHNGIYTVTQVGDGSHPYILTRAADADQASELVSAAVKVSEGSTQADNEYSCTTDGPLTIGTTALVWGVLSSGGSLASTTEQLAGTDASKRSTPDSVAALWEKGADVASSGTLTVGEGGYFHITGTTAITALALSVDKAGRKVWLKFDGALTLTHNATSLILPTGANIATAAGDIAGFVSEGSGNFRCFVYQRADGTALASSGGGGSALTVKDEGTDLDTAVTSFDFVGAGVTTTNSGHAVTVTIPGGGGTAWDFSPPAASYFTLQSSDATQLTLTDDADVGLLIDPGALSSNCVRMARKSLTTKASAWDLKAKIKGVTTTDSYSDYGIMVRDSIGGKYYRLAVASNAPLGVSHFSGYNTFVGTDYGTGTLQLTGIPLQWFRIAFDGTNLVFYTSAEGKLWTSLCSVTYASYLGVQPDQVMLYASYLRTTGQKLVMSCPYWSLTGPGV